MEPQTLQFNDTFEIGDRRVGAGCPVFIIAEAGVAHFGSIRKAFALVDLAVEAGADAVKFQIFKTDELIAGASQEWKERLRPKELPFEAFLEIQNYCNEKGILFFATAHEEESFEFLETLDVPAYKIGSGEVSNWPFIQKIAAKIKPVILSTGMYTLEDIAEALDAMAQTGNKDIAVLHCVTQYPTPPSNCNLKAIDTIRESFNVITGYSDHTEGFHIPLAAVARGAQIIEKHITLDYNVPNAQDWKVSCGTEDLPLMVRQIRDIEFSLGGGHKSPGADEAKSLDWARKSLVAAVDIPAGQRITATMVRAKRPGSGISPAEQHVVVGKTARTFIKSDTIITLEHLQ